MAYNLELAHRLKEYFRPFGNKVEEKKMFGGVAWMYKNKMAVGIIKENLMVRVVADKYEDILKEKHVRVMDFNKRVMREFVEVSMPGFKTDQQLNRWIELGIEHAESKS